MSIDIGNIIADFTKTLPLAGLDANNIKVEIQDLGCGHTPRALPRGQMAIYIFADGDRVLKVGKVGPKSNARFQTQHYLPGSSKSNLAKSLLDDETGACHEISAEEIGKWMKERLHRIDILLNAEVGVAVLAYLEAFLHCRLRPAYEGYKSQRV